MIIVQIFRDEDGNIERFSIEGHANFAKREKTSYVPGYPLLQWVR